MSEVGSLQHTSHAAPAPLIACAFERRAQQELDALLSALQRYVQLLPAVTPINGKQERQRLVDCLTRGQRPNPAFALHPARPPRQAYRLLEEARRRLPDSPFEALYEAKLKELELELQILDALGEAKRIRPLAARRFGSGNVVVPTKAGPRTLRSLAEELLAETEGRREPRTVSAEALAETMRGTARGLGMDLEVRVDPHLSAGAATGLRSIWVADRDFGEEEARRLVVHEVYGHAVASANSRSQPIRIFDFGTHGSFADQEGVSLYLEAQVGALQGYRLRMIAARVWTLDQMHAGASFASTATRLVKELGFDALDAITLSERAYRGGGLARDAAYLAGYQRVATHLAEAPSDLHRLRSGRLAVADLPLLEPLRAAGGYRSPRLCPELPPSWLKQGESRPNAAPSGGQPQDTQGGAEPFLAKT